MHGVHGTTTLREMSLSGNRTKEEAYALLCLFHHCGYEHVSKLHTVNICSAHDYEGSIWKEYCCR